MRVCLLVGSPASAGLKSVNVGGGGIWPWDCVSLLSASSAGDGRAHEGGVGEGICGQADWPRFAWFSNPNLNPTVQIGPGLEPLLSKLPIPIVAFLDGLGSGLVVLDCVDST
eukprot:scaffold80087_cov67-Attheya_sp.AAC.1